MFVFREKKARNSKLTRWFAESVGLMVVVSSVSSLFKTGSRKHQKLN